MPYIDPLGSLNLSQIVDRTAETVTDFTKDIEKVVSKVDTLIDSVDDNFFKDIDFDAFEKQFRDVKIPGFPVPQFENLINVFDSVKGLRIKKGLPQVEGFDQNVSEFDRIEKNLQVALSQDWKVNGKNPLILDAFALSGANFERDGYKGQYNWNVAFVNYILSKSGIEFFQTLGTKAYENYGTSVEYGSRFDRVRKNDLVIMQGLNNIRVMGFVQAYDPAKRTANVIVGNVDKTVKLVKNIPFAKNSKELFITNIRRNWPIPEKYNLPLYNVRSARSSTDAFESLAEGATSLLDKAGELGIDITLGQTLSKALNDLNPLGNITNPLGEITGKINQATDLLKNPLGQATTQVTQALDNVAQSAADSLKKRFK